HPHAIVGHRILEIVEEFRPFRPGPDQAHVSLQDIDELGELVQMEPSEDPSDRGDPGVAGEAPDRAALALAAVVHVPDLVHRGDLAREAEPLLRINRPTPRAQLHQDDGEEDNRHREEEHDQGQREIDPGLDCFITTVDRPDPNGGRRGNFANLRICRTHAKNPLWTSSLETGTIPASDHQFNRDRSGTRWSCSTLWPGITCPWPLPAPPLDLRPENPPADRRTAA